METIHGSTVTSCPKTLSLSGINFQHAVDQVRCSPPATVGAPGIEMEPVRRRHQFNGHSQISGPVGGLRIILFNRTILRRYMPYKNPEDARANYRKWCKENPERRRVLRSRYVRKKLGLNPYEAEAVYSSKDKCDICGKAVDGRNKHLDHDHKTLVIRGVLCTQCNVLIGMCNDSTHILTQAINYLSHSQGMIS